MRVGAHGSSSGPTHDPSPHDRLSSFTIHYTNIRGLNSNFSSVESHLATSSPNLFLLSETQLSSQSSPDPFQISHYNLYSRFRSKGGVCAYCNINTPIARLMGLESPHFDVLWLKIYLLTTTIFLCFCYCSPNATNFPSFFEYLTSCHDSLLSSHPHAEVLYIGDFNVHHTDWLKSTHTDVGGIEAFHFSISNELEQIIKHPTRVPDRHDHAANPLDLFFTSNPQNYTYTVSSPLGSSDHCTVSVTSTFTPPPPIPPTQRHLWHFENARRADMSNFLFDFPWEDYCFRTRDPDQAATAVGEVIDSGMKAYIPYSLITFSPSKPCLIVLAPLLSLIERERIDHIRLLLLSSLMLLLFLLGIAVLLSFVGLVHLSVKGKLISSTLLLLKNVSGPYPKKFSTTSVTLAFPHLFAPMSL